MSNPKLTSFVLLVNDVSKSKDFYVSVLSQEVAMDINNINVGFKSGLAIWDKTYASNVIFQKQNGGTSGSDNIELYFETDALDSLFEKTAAANCTLVHGIVTQPWQQRVFRFRDPDGYIIDIGETMETVVKRLLAEKLSIEEIAAKTFMPKDAVQAMAAL